MRLRGQAADQDEPDAVSLKASQDVDGVESWLDDRRIRMSGIARASSTAQADPLFGRQPQPITDQRTVDPDSKPGLRGELVARRVQQPLDRIHPWVDNAGLDPADRRLGHSKLRPPATRCDIPARRRDERTIRAMFTPGYESTHAISGPAWGAPPRNCQRISHY